MTARAESILDAVVTLVTGLTTTGSRVTRGRTYAVPAEPALAVDMGGEVPAGDPNMAYQDEYLDITVTAYAKGAQGTTDTTLNQIAAEVYAAVMASRQLGLAYVHDTRWMGRSEPQREPSDQVASAQELRFRVHYRHSYASMES
jgi:hypothetical protein